MYLYYTQVTIYSTFSIIELHEKSKILYYRSLILGQIELNLIIVKVEIFVFSVQFKSTKSLIALLASFSMRIDMLLLQGCALRDFLGLPLCPGHALSSALYWRIFMVVLWVRL